MAERAAAGTAVAVVVEDAIRLGVDTLAELEALTAADTGDSIGANIILMGPPELNQFLKDPALARLKQRVRRRETVAAFSQAEVTGYLKHCLRHAGAEYDTLFDPGIDQIVFRCSEGVPRVINTLCENALTAAMETGQKRVTTGLMHDIASENYTYEGPPPDLANAPDIDWESPPATKAVEAAPAENDSVAIDESNLPPSARNIVVESGRYPELSEDAAEATAIAADGEPAAMAESPVTDLPEADPEPVIVESRAPATVSKPEQTPAPADKVPSTPEPVAEAADELPVEAPAPAPEAPAPAKAAGPELPELINDTQPELSALSPHVMDEAAEPPSTPVEPTDPAPEKKSGSTVILEKPAGIEQASEADAVPEPVAEISEKPTENVEPDESASNEDESFDLDAALSIELDDTNLMQGITPNLDAMAQENEAAPVADATAPGSAEDDLPTLSNSMRVDVDKEVKKAKKAEAAEQHAAKPASRPAPSNSATRPKPAASKSAVPQPTPQTSRPAAARAEAPKPKTPPPSQTKKSAVRPKSPATMEPPKNAAAMADSPAADEPKVDKPVPDPPQSEMTARIASLDIRKRGSDVDSLEAALEAAKKGNLDDLAGPVVAPQVVDPSPAATSQPEPESEPVIPEITLDKELEEKQKAKRAELEKFAKEIGSANSLEEFSDAMAETLFGNEEFEAIAAEVVANPPEGHESAAATSDDHELVPPPPDSPSPVLLKDANPAGDPPSLSLELEPDAAAGAESAMSDGSMRESQAMRAEMLNSLQGGNQHAAAESIELGQSQRRQSPARSNGAQPESIENQMDTVMTQTLAALDVSSMAPPDDEDEKPKKKSGGLFARFRKSS
jgi:hypothetical protein